MGIKAQSRKSFTNVVFRKDFLEEVSDNHGGGSLLLQGWEEGTA